MQRFERLQNNLRGNENIYGVNVKWYLEFADSFFAEIEVCFPSGSDRIWSS